IESEILFAFSKSFNLINSLISENNFLVEIKTLHSIFNQLLSKEVIPFQGEPLKGIQIMGILESRTLDFKNVILLSVNEGLLPQGKTLNSFIPYDLKVHFKMPTYRESDAVFSYHFYRILQRAENVSILYNTESDDFGSGEKSRFITQLLSEYKGTINEFVFGGEELEFTEDKEIVIKNSSLQKEIENWSKYVSPSSLNKYINCSLSFYYHYLAKIRKEEEVSEFAEANNIGTAIHEALNKIYPKGVITSQSVNQIKEDLLRKVEEEFVEEMKGEDVRIIDYKTGKVSKSDVSIPDFNDLLENTNKAKAFQLLVYAYIYLKNKPQYSDREVIAGNFSFKNLKEGLLTVAKSINRKKETIIINKDVLNNVEEIITKIIDQIMNEDFRKTSEISRCEYCDYKAICNR
ncbi:MAG: PD-(D/E)XK nuclease family protein, partial [Flavobacteriales bacterium]